MSFKIQDEVLKKKWVMYLAGVAGVAGLAYSLHRYKKKQQKKPVKPVILTTLSEPLVVSREFKEREYNPEEKIFLRSKDVMDEKIFRINSSGVDALQVIIDFDQTITCFEHNGKPCSSCFSMVRNSSVATPEFVSKAQAGYLKYLPIEQDPQIPNEEKIKYLEEWWKLEEDLMANLNLDKQKLSLILEGSNIAIRSGFSQFMKVCELAQLPLCIVSGGILDFMKPILSKYVDLNNDQVKLFGNVMQFDENGHFRSFVAPHLNSLHKEKILSKENTQAQIRKNAILIGDSINDRLMTLNLGLEFVIAIGFLSPDKKDQLDRYMEAYDIVILGEGNFTQIEILLREILDMPQRDALKRVINESDTPLKQFLNLELRCYPRYPSCIYQ